jgi:HrpA-like RNA helicase
LYSSETAAAFAAHDEPEIARVPLESTVLQIMAMGSADPVALLSEALQPPSPQSVSATIEALAALSAIEPDPSRKKLSFKFRLTPLGAHMSRLPCDVRIAKLLLLATTFRCIRPVLDVAACLSHRTPFSAPFDMMHELNAARDSFASPSGATFVESLLLPSFLTLRSSRQKSATTCSSLV